jgi:hypothetical protein
MKLMKIARRAKSNLQREPIGVHFVNGKIAACSPINRGL